MRALGISFHVAGGLASSYYSEPRLTQGVDLVVNLDARQGRLLVEATRKSPAGDVSDATSIFG